MKKLKRITRRVLHRSHKIRSYNRRKKRPVIVHKKKTRIRSKPKKISIIAKDIPVIVISTPIKFPRKRRSKSKDGSRMYFTDETEKAIISYNNEDDVDVRETIFREKIHHPFQKLVENVFNTFKFSYFKTSPQDVQKECLTHLVANMHKFDPNRQSKLDPTKKAKAFAYFSIIAKHYLILLNNTNYKEFNQNVEISDERNEDTVQLQQNDKYYARQELSDFICLIIKFWEKNINKIFTKQRDLNIANAVVELFRSSNNIQMFNKKALYLYIREIAMCKTQQITKILKKMKIYHDKMKYSYQNNGVIETEIRL